MATRTLNMTGRSRITSEMFDIEAQLEPEGLQLQINWSFEELGLPESALCFLDVDNPNFERRFELHGLKGEAVFNLEPGLTKGGIGYQVIVVTSDARGIPLIRAASKRGAVDSETGESTLKSPLIVVPDSDLRIPWKLDFTTGDVRLLVAAKDNLWSELKASPFFKNLIAGPLVFEIALHLMDTSESVVGEGLSKWIDVFERYGFDSDSDFEDMELSEKIDFAKAIAEKFQEDKKILEKLVLQIETEA